MEPCTLVCLVLTALTVLFLVAVDLRSVPGQRPRAVWVLKPLASTGFVVTALVAGAWASGPGRVLLVALVCCHLGDVLLIPKSPRAFLGGLVAFIAGHIAFAILFVWRGISPGGVVLGLVLMIPVALAVLRWLWPHLTADFRKPIAAYVILISAMVVLAAGSFAARPLHLLLIGALLFAGSDILIARHRFVRATRINKLTAIPAYYAAQLLFALSAGQL